MIDLKAIRKWQARGDIPALVDWIERASMLLGCASFVGAGTDACHECGRIAAKLFSEVHAESEVPVYPQFTEAMLQERVTELSKHAHNLEEMSGKLFRQCVEHQRENIELREAVLAYLTEYFHYDPHPCSEFKTLDRLVKLTGFEIPEMTQERLDELLPPPKDKR